MGKVNIAEQFALMKEPGAPKVVAKLNGQVVELVLLKGEIAWHCHKNEDELFLVIKGRIRIDFRDRQVWLEEGEFLVAPRGVEHHPVAEEEAYVLLFEPDATRNTSAVQNEKTLAGGGKGELIKQGCVIEKVNIAEKFAQIKECWSPKIAAELNGQVVKLVKLDKGELVWHHHENEDEMFLVTRGQMRIDFRNRQVWLSAGELIVVPHGVEHIPVVEEEAHQLLFEPENTSNTGNVQNEMTLTSLDRI